MAVQVVGNQKAETSTVKGIKSKSKKDNSITLDYLVENYSDEINAIVNETVPEEKRDSVALNILRGIRTANREQKIEKVYDTYHKSDVENFIRTVRTKVDGYIDYNKGCTLEKYNPESNTWEEYQELAKTLTFEEMKKQVSDVHHNILLIACDIEALSKILEDLPDSDNEELLDSAGIQCMGRTLNAKAKLLLAENDKLEELDDALWHMNREEERKNK